jgi:hypothetical protein
MAEPGTGRLNGAEGISENDPPSTSAKVGQVVVEPDTQDWDADTVCLSEAVLNALLEKAYNRSYEHCPNCTCGDSI